MAIPTPADLKAAEDQQREKYVKRVESDLERQLNYAFNKNQIKSTGGEIEYRISNPDAQQIARDYLANKGWAVEFTFRDDSSWSSTSKEDRDIKVHYLKLTPLQK